MVPTPARLGRASVLVPLLALLLAAAPLLLTVYPAAAQPLTFTVTTTGDEPDLQISDDRCDVSTADGLQCTLRAAIQEANNTPGANTIEFDIPGPGLKTIQPASELPRITQRTTINGYTQPGSSANTAPTGTNAVLRIQLDGVNAGASAVGLDVTTGDNTLIRGLVINRFDGDGIQIDSTASDVSVLGCFLGTNSAGTAARGNDDGIDPNGPDATIGGTNLAARNLLSGNDSDGIEPDGDGTRILNNLIGTTKTGTGALGNDDDGVDVGAFDTTTGSNLATGANVIAFNGDNGVEVDDERNRILINSIFANGDLGIDLDNDGRTANDANDADAGANTLQNFPVITVATSNTVQGTLNSTPNRTFFLRLFSNPGASNEGKFFEEGALQVTTNGAGNANFTFSNINPPIPAGRSVTATATNAAGNTSEFSDAVAVVP